jgi:hypothetical protein
MATFPGVGTAIGGVGGGIFGGLGGGELTSRFRLGKKLVFDHGIAACLLG